jgi:hypothetical protein
MTVARLVCRVVLYIKNVIITQYFFWVSGLFLALSLYGPLKGKAVKGMFSLFAEFASLCLST